MYQRINTPGWEVSVQRHGWEGTRLQLCSESRASAWHKGRTGCGDGPASLHGARQRDTERGARQRSSQPRGCADDILQQAPRQLGWYRPTAALGAARFFFKLHVNYATPLEEGWEVGKNGKTLERVPHWVTEDSALCPAASASLGSSHRSPEPALSHWKKNHP